MLFPKHKLDDQQSHKKPFSHRETSNNEVNASQSYADGLEIASNNDFEEHKDEYPKSKASNSKT